MSSADDTGKSDGRKRPATVSAPSQTMECRLFESLVHLMIEKGVLSRNDALSVVQTVAEVTRGAAEEQHSRMASADRELALLRRLYASFELVPERARSPSADGLNVLQLRPPLHGDRPKFPKDD